MKALVAVKRVVDHNVHVHIKPDGSAVETAGVKMSVNPFDEIAIEAALRLKESGAVSEIVAVTLGEAASQDVLRHALAMGVDRAVLVEAHGELQPLGVAKLLQAVVAREAPQLVLLGKQAIDDDAGQVGQMLAARLGVGQGTFASVLTVEGGEVRVVREVDGGTETVALKLPAVITADLRLAEPRFVKLPNLMMAKKKPIDTIAADSLGVDYAPRLKQLKLAEPPQRAPGVKVGSVAELVQKLREAKVV
ncbi:electron transfer flavoprotein subunit beta/FixA family protein [Chitiniphilus purpureus]|uniref:Electron transfer flavoprotein subunit beta n=1 Tax=Chitiniphilus purpureus TaxID=2981137 RepID=A0ABY6DP87_9NEIS|nr:electron transfer flavoprotein subunit beta/FixA family protein [Chitiniphilus sp. CD1]UXY16038.1 electron transfer flavoprotein subunit beta/FixA family protein [Chitiniphilus sp. CD1]